MRMSRILCSLCPLRSWSCDMSCFIAVISLSDAVRIAASRLLRAEIESVGVRTRTDSPRSADARCTESAALELTRADDVLLQLVDRPAVAKKQPLGHQEAEREASH